MLADPSAAGDAKAALAARLLAAADPRTVAVAQDLARSRWSADADLADAAQRLGTSAVLAAAQSAGTLEQVEQEPVRRDRCPVGAAGPAARVVRPLGAGEARADLAERVLGSHVSATTLLLARRAAAAPAVGGTSPGSVTSWTSSRSAVTTAWRP